MCDVHTGKTDGVYTSLIQEKWVRALERQTGSILPGPAQVAVQIPLEGKRTEHTRRALGRLSNAGTGNCAQGGYAPN